MSFIARIADGLAGGMGWQSPQRKYGRRADSLDSRDHKYVPSKEVLASLLAQVDMRAQDGAIFDQGQLGSCTANCWLGMYMFVQKKLYGDTFLGSRLQLYYDERALSGNVNTDSGAEMRDGAKCLAEIGVGPETLWPYSIAKFKQKPPLDCYTEAAKHKLVTYMSLSQDLTHLKACLNEGFPFIFGFNVTQSFESFSVQTTGIVPMPGANDKVIGGHCMEALGYIDNDGTVRLNARGLLAGIGHNLRLLTGSRMFSVQPPNRVFICRNSWGDNWGDDGYCYVPFDFITNNKWCQDFWTVRQVSHSS